MTSVPLSNLPQSNYLKASEIAQYHFCSISWYLQKIGVDPQSQRLKEGTQYHEEIGMHITEIRDEQNSGVVFFMLSFICFTVAFILLRWL